MCSGSSPKPSPNGLIEEHEYERQEELHQKVSALLEFSATDDLMAFKDAVEKDDHGVDEVGLWYGRKIGSKEMSYEERTPLMIAALFGSKGVLSYILGTGRVHVNRRCGSDGATALHCAVFGCSANSPEVIKLLLDASADVSSVDANGNRSSDLIASVSNSIFGSRKRILQAILEGTDDVDVVDDDYYFKEEKQQPNAGTPRIEKKDYPIDLSLPDIKNGIYSSDEFRMFSFKVKTCSRAYSHDWTECPFVHPGENARRRDPKKYHYTCVPCPEFRKGSCSKGDGCEYAHGIFECWLHPAQYRTRLCKDETECTRRVCFFAHKPEELRPLYASTGSALPSPRSMDPYTLNSPSSLIQRASTPPLTPSAASSPMNGTMLWQTQLHSAAVPTLQMPRSRLKTSLNVRDTDLDMELLELENRLMRKLMMEEMAAGISTPSKWQNSMPNSPSYPVSLTDHMGESNRFSGVNPTNLEDIFASHFQSPNGMQNVNQQLWGYPSDVTTSNRIGSPPFMADPSMNPRYAAFSKRSQSFIERGVASFNSELPSVTSVAAEPSSTFSGWGSSNGKLDWSICGDELNKMRKSYSFAFQNRNSSTSTIAATAVPPNDGEPDVSWINSLVKDAPTMEYDQCCVED